MAASASSLFVRSKPPDRLQVGIKPSSVKFRRTAYAASLQARGIKMISPMTCDSDTRPTRTTSRARPLSAHALGRISSTFSSRWRERTGGAATVEGALTRAKGNPWLDSFGLLALPFLLPYINVQKTSENEPSNQDRYMYDTRHTLCEAVKQASSLPFSALIWAGPLTHTLISGANVRATTLRTPRKKNA